MFPAMRFRLVATAWVALVTACGSSSATGGTQEFRWGGDAEGGAPFVEADPADPTRVRGFDVDVAGMIARGLGREPRFVQVQWASIVASAERGDFHAGLSGIEDSREL